MQQKNVSFEVVPTAFIFMFISSQNWYLTKIWFLDKAISVWGFIGFGFKSILLWNIKYIKAAYWAYKAYISTSKAHMLLLTIQKFSTEILLDNKISF